MNLKGDIATCFSFYAAVKEPPYQVSESGYGSFNLPIEVVFRNKEEPRKVVFEYDLLLPNLDDPPINQMRSECLTFQNPSEEFRQKLLKGYVGQVLLQEINYRRFSFLLICIMY